MIDEKCDTLQKLFSLSFTNQAIIIVHFLKFTELSHFFHNILDKHGPAIPDSNIGKPVPGKPGGYKTWP